MQNGCLLCQIPVMVVAEFPTPKQAKDRKKPRKTRVFGAFLVVLQAELAVVSCGLGQGAVGEGFSRQEGNSFPSVFPSSFDLHLSKTPHNPQTPLLFKGAFLVVLQAELAVVFACASGIVASQQWYFPSGSGIRLRRVVLSRGDSGIRLCRVVLRGCASQW